MLSPKSKLLKPLLRLIMVVVAAISVAFLLIQPAASQFQLRQASTLVGGLTQIRVSPAFEGNQPILTIGDDIQLIGFSSPDLDYSLYAIPFTSFHGSNQITLPAGTRIQFSQETPKTATVSVYNVSTGNTIQTLIRS